MTFAERLRELREKAGLTQEGLARKCGLSVGAVRNYEQGIREPYWHLVFKLADVLGVSCEVFKDCVPEDEPPPEPLPRGRPRKPAAGQGEAAKPKRKGKRKQGS